MRSFLEQTVDQLCERYGDQISDLCIVLPNRRAGLFLKTHFSEKLQKTFWSPEIYATEDFVTLLSALQPAEPATLLFELYETVRSIHPNSTESFDDFSKWGQIYLMDLNEIDRYLVDTKVLFGNLKSIKELESWSLNNEPLTDFQQQYLHFWQSLGEYYQHYTAQLLEKKISYQGLAYRVVAENPVERAVKHGWKKIIFAGFNALNKAEEVIIAALLDAGLAEIIWDADSYYLDDIQQEAGRFLRKYEQSGQFKKHAGRSFLIKEELLCHGKKNIHVIGAAKNVAQAKVAGTLIKELQANDPSLQHTALVLADENLLFPVLHSLPEDIRDVNVTMGYPLKNTPVAGYFDLLFTMHEVGLKSAKGKTTYSFYHRDLVKLLSHPYTATAVGGRGHALNLVLEKIQRSNLVFAASSTLEKRLFGEEYKEVFLQLRPLFGNWSGPSDALQTLKELIDLLRVRIMEQSGEEGSNKTNLELEYLFAFTKIIKRIQVMMDTYPECILSVKTLRTILNQLIRTTTLPFYGEPLMGLQMMGMLETRTLDFDQVVLLSCNEDVLPSGKTSSSFVPYELKRHFGLPTYSDKDAIFAYHFYRLLQRAETIYLVYNTEQEALGGGEVSRFLTQLMYELPKLNPQATITQQLVNIPVRSDAMNTGIVIQKDQRVMEKLQARIEYGLSPSSLNKYRNCSLEFYFHAIAGLREVEEVEEVIGADVLGSAIHEVLEILYQPFVGRVVNGPDIEAMKPQVEELTIRSLEKHYSQGDISFGKNLLTLKVAIKFINNFLDQETKYIDQLKKEGKALTILALESELQSELEIFGAPVKLKGNADRIDRVGELIRIVDYKTGLAEKKELEFDDFEELMQDSGLNKSFQLMMYAWMYDRMKLADKAALVSGIISFRELSKGLKSVSASGKKLLKEEELDQFETQLKVLLSKVMDPGVDFVQTEDTGNCQYCSFKGVCGR